MDFTWLNNIHPRLLGANRNNHREPFHKNGSSFGHRIVEKYELDIIVEGNGAIITDGIKYPARRGCVFFRKPGIEIEGITPYENYYFFFDIFKLNIHEGTLDRDNFLHTGFPPMIQIQNFETMEELCENLYQGFIHYHDIHEFITLKYIMCIFHEIQRQTIHNLHSEHIEKYSYHIKTVELVKKHVSNNLSKQFSLQELAKMAGMSPYHFCTVFRQLAGEAPFQYIHRVKINKARQLVLETNMQVKEIIIECGFESESYFYKVFKKAVGETPLSFVMKSKPWLK
jgi:AraC-like DNA-binding protein